ncbi:MAG: Alpha-L-fucosidase [Phycisphaerales bacterium]|nr:Alpha-L-fucosidase [Phycisphaerales bacterium]
MGRTVQEWLQEADRVGRSGPFRPEWESLAHYQVPAWYQDAKFGIFIHWGGYSVPAFGNEWYPRDMYRPESPTFEHHRQTYGPQDQVGYKEILATFKAQHFDPDAWATLIRRSGAKFVIPVAEHHDGVAMYDTQLSEWSVVHKGPQRDLIGDLAAACRKQFLTVGASSHRAEHWWFYNGGMKVPSDVQDPQYADLYGPAMSKQSQPSAAFLDDWLARTCEMVDLLRPAVMYFDWWIEEPAFDSHFRRFLAYYYNRAAAWGSGVAVNYKIIWRPTQVPPTAAILDIERGQLADIRPLFWQTCTSVANNSWGYTEGNVYKPPRDIIHDLMDIVSKNGCLLLNIGPRADGTIPHEDQHILLEIGRWLGVNGDAVFDTRPWKVFGEGPTQVLAGEFMDTKRDPFTAQDIRFTTKDRTLYATLLGLPRGEAVIRSLSTSLRLYGHEIDRVELLGHPDPLPWTRDDRGLVVRLPETLPSDIAVVLKIVALPEPPRKVTAPPTD